MSSAIWETTTFLLTASTYICMHPPPLTLTCPKHHAGREMHICFSWCILPCPSHICLSRARHWRDLCDPALQNADDARASVVKFCLDLRHHPAGPEALLLAPSLAPFQGPGLLVYNDGIFSEADMASISRVGDSGKRAQAGKTGRFGCVGGWCWWWSGLL